MRAGLIVLLAVLSVQGCSKETAEPADRPVAVIPADLVFINGGIYTVDGERSQSEAAAIRDGIFERVGANSDVEAVIGPETRIIDLTGKWVLPGFHDAHVHPVMGGQALLGCDLDGKRSVEAILSAVRDCAGKAEEGWIEGQAFDLGLFGQDGPHKSLLDAIEPDRPVILWASDGHNAWANSRALELAGITAETKDPALGVIERDVDGTPSGTLRETAKKLVLEAMPNTNPESNTKALRAGIRHLNSMGVTSYIDARVGPGEFRAYAEIDRAGELTARVVTSLGFVNAGSDGAEDFERMVATRDQHVSERLSHGSVKFFIDGVLEGETAALLEPYAGMNGHRGELILSPQDLNAAVSRFDAMGLQVHMHAIGDRAARAGLDAIEAARRENGAGDNRHHISHLQLVHVDDIERFASLDTAANFQAAWAYPDQWIMELNLPVLGEERVQGMYPIGSIERAGGRIVGGSDWNVSSANPLYAIEAAVRRQDPETDSGLVLNATERVSLASMIEAYTINAAWLMHQENVTGSIEVGKKADLVVLDRDLFEVPVTEIDQARVVMTLLDGEIIYFDQGSGY